MAKTRSMTKKQKHDDKRDWADANHDMLYSVMMKLAVIDYVAFSKVCKSWRSVAVCNRNKFIMSSPPMSISVSADEKEWHLVDYEGRKLKINVPHSGGRTCIGVTCGYLILCSEKYLFCSEKTRDFWLVNPITRHQLHFDFPFPEVELYVTVVRATLLLSESGWVFAVCSRWYDKIWFCLAGKREWSYVSTPANIWDLHTFKGKIYTLDLGNRLCEVRLFPTPKVTLLEFKNTLKPSRYNHPRFVSSGEHLYVMDLSFKYPYKKIEEIDFSKMEWVSCEEECGFFLSSLNYGAAVIRAEPWAEHQSKYAKYARPDQENGKGRFLHVKMWYFFHDSLNLNLLHRS